LDLRKIKQIAGSRISGYINSVKQKSDDVASKLPGICIHTFIGEIPLARGQEKHRYYIYSLRLCTVK
jgi:hypothetical protein